jgi:protein-tyrosine kinase
MKRTNLALEEYSERDLLRHGHGFREVEFNAPDDLLIVDLIELYMEIKYALADEGGMVVQFVSASSSLDSEQIALDMAWACASVLGRKILILNCTKSRRPALTVADSPVQPMTTGEGMVKVTGQEMYLADLRGWHTKTGALAATDEIDEHLDELRAFFDMVVMVAPAADTDPLGAVLAQHVDGNVIVLEAERTRRSAAIRLRQILSRSGRPIVGAVLNNRRNYIPRWLARFL